MSGETSDWSVYRIQVLSELKRINDNVEKLADSDTEIRITIGRLQLCATLMGGIAGALVSITSVILITMWGRL